MSNLFDVIVVGAGYIGSSVAYHLCAAGLRTALFDKGSMAAGASRASYGSIQVQDLELSKSVELIRLARTRLAALEENLEQKVGFRRIGGLLLIENENQWQMMAARLKALHSQGIHSELVPAAHLRELEPFLDPSTLLGGLYHEQEGQVDPFLLIWGYLVQARHLGLKDFYFTEVTGFDVKNGRLEGIITSHGNYRAGKVVLCTGAYTRKLGRLLGREWDIQYILGQAMVTEPARQVLHNHISSASFFEQTLAQQEGSVSVGLAISQSIHGQLLLGEAMLAADSLQSQVPSQSLEAIAGNVLRYFPAFSRLRVRRSWSAPVAYTPDWCPWLGPVPGIAGLFLATAFRSTVVVTPLIGELVTQLVTGGNPDLNIENFLPERNLDYAH